MDSRVIVNLLEQVKLDESIGIDGYVCPVNIPVTGFHIILHLPSEIVGNVGDNGILGGWIMRKRYWRC